LSCYYIHKKENYSQIPQSNSVSFLQIVSTSNLKDKTKKMKQFENLESSIKENLPIKKSKIMKYKLIYGNISDFEDKNSNKWMEVLNFLKGSIAV